MFTADQLSSADFRDADAIIVFDPATDKAVTVWGDDVLNGEPRVVEIACHEGDLFTFRKIVETVRAIQGCVSSHVSDPPRFT